MLWQVSPDRSKQLKAITDEAKKADTLILATDPDREGEAISWHVQEVLRQKKALPANVQRVTFNAITNSAVTEAMKQPRGLDEDLIDAYRARRALDYLVGFTLSPILWRKLPGRQVGGPRAVGRAAPDRRPRARDRDLQGRRNIGRSARRSRRTGRASPRGWSQLDGKKIDRLTIGSKRRGRCGQGGGRGGPVHRLVGRDQAVRAEPAAAVHHLDPAAGGGAQARLFGEPHDAGRAGALRGRADHLHADRRRRHGARGGERGAPGDRQPLRRRLRARQAAPISQARSRTRRKRTRRSGRPISTGRARRRAITRGSTSWSTIARWRARWRRRGSSGRRSS